MRILCFLLFIPCTIFAQQRDKITELSVKRINSVLIYRPIPIDSAEREHWDSLLNSTIKLQWETSLKRNSDKSILATRVLKRMQVFYLDQSTNFYDSDKPKRLLGALSIFNRFSEELVNKRFSEFFSFERNRFNNEPSLFDIRAFDTINYTKALYFLHKTPLNLKENDKWIDSVSTTKYSLKDYFTVKSIISNRLILQFKGILTFVNSNQKNNDELTDKGSIDFYDNSLISEGYLIVDLSTKFIYYLEGTVLRKSSIKNQNGTVETSTASDKFILSNSGE